MFYVYLIQSEKDQSFYIGQAQNLDERLRRHNTRYVHATQGRIPWKLIGYEEYATREEARWREYNLKHKYTEKRKFIKKFLSP